MNAVDGIHCHSRLSAFIRGCCPFLSLECELIHGTLLRDRGGAMNTRQVLDGDVGRSLVAP